MNAVRPTGVPLRKPGTFTFALTLLFGLGCMAWVHPAEAADEAARYEACQAEVGAAEATEHAAHPERAAEMFSHASENCPRLRPVCYYALARCYAAMGRPGLGYRWLQRSVKEGFWDSDTIEHDPDLAGIRKLRMYKRGFPTLRAEIERERASRPPVTCNGARPTKELRGILVLVHPDGASAKEMLALFETPAAEKGIGCVAPEGPTVIGKERREWGHPPDAIRRIREAVTLAKFEWSADALPVWVAGIGSGGRLALLYAFSEIDRVAGVVSIGAPLDSAVVQMASAGGSKPRTLLSIRPTDEDVVRETNRAVCEAMKKRNLECRVLNGLPLNRAISEILSWMVPR